MSNEANLIGLTSTAAAICGPYDGDQIVLLSNPAGDFYIGFSSSITTSSGSGSFEVTGNISITLERGQTLYALGYGAQADFITWNID